MHIERDGFLQRRALLARGRRLAAGIALALMSARVPDALAQAPTPDPSAWRPFAYADLRHPSADAATYADLWKGAVEADGTSSPRDLTQSPGDAAPVTEAHFVIWSAGRSAVVSILDTATGCAFKERRPVAGATVKLCPMRVAIYEGIRVRAFDAGRGCMLELAPPVSDTSQASDRAGAYASYNVTARIIRIGLVVDHQPVEGCSLSIPLRP